VNHASIAAEAIRFRIATLQHPLVDPERFDVDRAAALAVGCGDPVIDSAIRRLGAAWRRAGNDLRDLCEPWRHADARRLLAVGGDDLIDALDDMVRSVCSQDVFT
jgi:hypothetical protein